MSKAKAAATTTTSTESSSGNITIWKNPSVANQQKYNLVPLPDDFEPTDEERDLLSFYETVRSYERQATRLKEEAARAKLAAKDAEFQKHQATQAASQKRAKRKKKKEYRNDDEEENSEDSDDSEDDDDLEEEAVEEKLQDLRKQIEAQMGDTEAEKEALRDKLLTTSNTTNDGPTLKRKRLDDYNETEDKTSLIANLGNLVTPPHEFSKSLEIKPWHGKVLFPTSEDETTWTPPDYASHPDDGAFTVELPAFDVAQSQNGQGNNTIAIKFMAPQEAKRFSLNVAAPDHDNFHSVLFHFNPRQFERGGQLVLNNKQEGLWGQAINVPLSTVPMIFGQVSCTLIIQVNGDGFDAFLNDKHIARLEHRRDLSDQNALFLNFPATDDYNHPENWRVFKVWWGNKPIMAKGDLSGVPGYNNFNSVHPRKLFISKLPKIHTDPEVDLRRAELERAFRKYGGDRGVNVVVPKNSTFAFVEMESERQADLALNEMSMHYRLNRARRTRHEALQEERAAAEALKRGEAPKKANDSDW